MYDCVCFFVLLFLCFIVVFFFFFSSRRRHTRCSRDWSSDVCSSDLRYRPRERFGGGALRGVWERDGAGSVRGFAKVLRLLRAGRVAARAGRHRADGGAQRLGGEPRAALGSIKDAPRPVGSTGERGPAALRTPPRARAPVQTGSSAVGRCTRRILLSQIPARRSPTARNERVAPGSTGSPGRAGAPRPRSGRALPE